MRKKGSLLLLFSCLTIIAYNQVRSLDFYLEKGVQNSPLLNDYRNQVSSASADSLLVKASLKPAVDVKSMLLYSPYYHNFGYDEVITDGGNYTAVVGVSQNIFNKREQDNRLKSVDLQKRLLKNSALLSEKELRRTITDQYLTTYTDFSDFEFNKSFLKLYSEENEIVLQFVKSGVARQTDYLALIIETQAQEILLSQLKNQFRRDLLLLNQLCGINDTSLYELTQPEIIMTGTPDILKSPSYIQYRIDSIRIDNERQAIDIRYKPKVGWFADAGFLTSNPWNFYQHFGYSAGVSLSMPIYDGKQRSIEKQKLTYDENSRKAYADNYRKQYQLQVEQLDDELNTLKDVSSRLDLQLKNSDQLVITLKEQLNAGNIQMTDYINAVKNLRTIRRTINLVSIQKLQVINEMNFLLTK